MPSSRRPDSTDTSACPPSCAIVMTFPASRHDRESSTTAMAMSPVRPTTQAGGSGWLPETRSQSRAMTLTAAAAVLALIPLVSEVFWAPMALAMMGGLIAATIFAFTVSWAQFLYPLAFTTSADQLVLPVGIITTLTKGDVFNWGQIMTGALLGAAPPLIIYAFLMDYYIAGLTAGATKG